MAWYQGVSSHTAEYTPMLFQVETDCMIIKSYEQTFEFP